MVEPFQKSLALNIDRTLPVYDLYGVPTDAAKRIAQGFLNTITPWAEGTSIQTRITGILLEDQNQIKANRRPIDFFSPSTGLTAQTLRVVSSIFQGSRAFIRKRADEAYANSPWNSVPMPFDPSLANQFSTWISNSSEVAHQDWNTGKASFYRILQQMMHTVFDFPYDTYSSFAYCLRNSQHPRGLGIFKAFFPNIDRLLEVHINSNDAQKTDINGITKTIESLTHLQANTSQLKVADILSKLLYDRSRKGTVYTNAKLPDVIKSLRKLAALGKADISPSELAVELEILSNPTTPITEKRVEELKRRVSPSQLVIQPIREKTKFETVSKGDFLRELEHEDNFWNPIYAGLLLNLGETALLRSLGCDHTFVVSPAAIRNNPDAFATLQDRIYIGVQRELKLNLDDIPFDPPQKIPNRAEHIMASERRAFNEQMESLVAINPNMRILMHRAGFERVRQHLPITRIGPYVVAATPTTDDMVPVLLPLEDKKRKNDILEALNENERRLINRVPFLYHVVLKREGRDIVDFEMIPTVPYLFFKQVDKEGGYSVIDHGTYRYLISEAFLGEIRSEDYTALRTKFGKLDIDNMVGRIRSIASVAKKVVDDVNGQYQLDGRGRFIASPSQGRGMAGTEYVTISNLIPQDTSLGDAYEIGHDPSAMMQSFSMWSGGRHPEGRSDFVIQTALTVSAFRAGYFIPQWLQNRGAEIMALTLFDPLNSVQCYVEAGGGVKVGSVYRNAIYFPKLEHAFNPEEISSFYYVLRTVADLIYTYNKGVLIKSNVLLKNRHEDHWEDVVAGSAQIEEVILKLFVNRDRLISASHTIQKQDLRREMEKVKRYFDEDPLAMIILFSSGKYSLRERGIVGISLSVFFPFFDAIRLSDEVWQKIVTSVIEGKRREDESGMEFITRTILETEGAKEIIVNAIREMFIKYPREIGRKLPQIQLNLKRGSAKPVEYENLSLMVLDPDGLGAMAQDTNAWNLFLKSVIGEDDSQPELPLHTRQDLERVIKVFQLYNSPRSAGLRANLAKESGKKRKIEALTYLLTWPGFD